MEPIDSAAQQLGLIAAEIDKYKDTIHSEQDTRLKVVDRIITQVLGWPLSDILTEEKSGQGFSDYKLTIGGLARLIIEAKKDERELGLQDRTPGRAYKLNGPVFHSDSAREGIEQGIRYCGQKNAELACVTNGHEWIVFRGSRVGDGRDTMDGMAFVFPSLDSLNSHFSLFYDLLSREAVAEFRYRAHFQEAEGRPIRTQNFRAFVRHPDSRRLLQHDKLSSDIDRVMTSFFRRLSGDNDPEMLAKCFVVTKESRAADERLARISEDIVSRIRTLDTSNAEQLTELVQRVKLTQRNEFVVLVGTKGAGKSTFIDRFFKHVLPRTLRENCVVARVNLADSEGHEASVAPWLDRHLLDSLEAAIFHNEAPTYEELQGMFFDEYQRRSTGTLKHLYERDKEEFKIDFGKHIENRREERPHEYIQRLVKHVVRGRQSVPCIIFDNADHFTIEFQERVFQYARSIYESEICLVIVPITDRTSWQLSRQGALQSFENESLFLPTPSPQVVLEKRIEFLEIRLAEEKREPGRGYFFNRGITLSIDNLVAFTAALQSVFLRSGEVSWWIGNLANRDIRRSLELAKNLVTSPHLEVHELVKTYVADSSISLPPHKIKRALIKGQYDIYPVGLHSFIRNIYSIDDEIEASPMLGLRILRMLRDAQKSTTSDSFVTIEQVIDYCRAMMIDPRITTAWLGRLLEFGLCLNYDPTVTMIGEAGKIELSPSGFQHLRWGTRETSYIQAMKDITPLFDQPTFEQLSNLARRPIREVWKEELKCFIHYLISEDNKYCKVPDHEAFISQKRLPGELTSLLART